MRIALRRGRLFDDRDSPKAPAVALVNEAFVRRYFQNEDPIGKTVDVGRTLQRRTPGNMDYILHGTSTIVGVVADVRQTDVLAEPKPQIWNAYGQRRWLSMTVAIRTAGDPVKLAGILRSELRAVDRAKPLTNIRTAEEYYSGALAQRRVSMILVCALAAVALVLSAGGAYGVIAYSVTQRRHEIGIRMALGAQGGDVVRMVVRQGLTMAGIGLVIGVPAALAAARLLGSVLYEIKPHDPVTFAGLILLFAAVAAAASYLPARQATKVSPTVALRFE
jgi:putative ABC transport system permease protein